MFSIPDQQTAEKAQIFQISQIMYSHLPHFYSSNLLESAKHADIKGTILWQ